LEIIVLLSTAHSGVIDPNRSLYQDLKTHCFHHPSVEAIAQRLFHCYREIPAVHQGNPYPLLNAITRLCMEKSTRSRHQRTFPDNLNRLRQELNRYQSEENRLFAQQLQGFISLIMFLYNEDPSQLTGGLHRMDYTSRNSRGAPYSKKTISYPHEETKDTRHNDHQDTPSDISPLSGTTCSTPPNAFNHLDCVHRFSTHQSTSRACVTEFIHNNEHSAERWINGTINALQSLFEGSDIKNQLILKRIETSCSHKPTHTTFNLVSFETTVVNQHALVHLSRYGNAGGFIVQYDKVNKVPMIIERTNDYANTLDKQFHNFSQRPLQSTPFFNPKDQTTHNTIRHLSDAIHTVLPTDTEEYEFYIFGLSEAILNNLTPTEIVHAIFNNDSDINTENLKEKLDHVLHSRQDEYLARLFLSFIRGLLPDQSFSTTDEIKQEIMAVALNDPYYVDLSAFEWPDTPDPTDFLTQLQDNATEAICNSNKQLSSSELGYKRSIRFARNHSVLDPYSFFITTLTQSY